MRPFAIATTGLARSFGRIRAVAGLDLGVPVGSVYGFLGPNGAGKTTTIRMLLGLIWPDQGEIRLFDRAVTPATRREALRRIGALVDAPSLYPHLTGRENLQVTQGLVGLPASSVDRALQLVQLGRDASRLVSSYSLGMRQRLGLALALLGEPDLLILDEPTNGLDPAGIHEVRDLIRRLPAEHGVTVFLSSHLLGEVEQVATHVGIVGRGTMLFQGALAELQARQGASAILEVDQPTTAVAALRRGGWPITRWEGASLTVELPDRDSLPRLAATLVQAGVGIYELRPERQSLEELFLVLTRSHGLGPATTPLPTEVTR